jgi:hypothetical protein
VTGRRRPDALLAANIAFAVTVVLHGIDHSRQARGVGALATEVVAGGTVIFVLTATTLVLSLRNHPRAALFAAVIGLSTAVGVSLSHLAPHWSAFSDPYADLSLDVLSWIVMLAEIAAAAVLGIVGLRELPGVRRSAAGYHSTG